MGDSFGSKLPNIGGQRRTWDQVTVDGLNGNELSGTSRMNSSINLDAIAEVKVLLNTYKAEFGHTAGANIEIVSKSGSAGLSRKRLLVWPAATSGMRRLWENERAGHRQTETEDRHAWASTWAGRSTFPACSTRPAEKKLFFFYSLRSAAGQPPWSGPELDQMPTDREMQGQSFSQTLDSQGRLVFIRDPLASPARATPSPAGQPVSPATSFRRTGSIRTRKALLNMLPRGNNFSIQRLRRVFSSTTRPRRTPTTRRCNNVVRARLEAVGAPTALYFTFKDWYSDLAPGSGITAGPAKWGFLNGTYVSGDSGINGGWNRVFLIEQGCEFGVGVRRATEGFGTAYGCRPGAPAQKKPTVGYTLGPIQPAAQPARP